MEMLPSIPSKYHYELGDQARDCDMKQPKTNIDNFLYAVSLKRGDVAFILRSDRIWRFAVVAQVVVADERIDFFVDKSGSIKQLYLKHWNNLVRAVCPSEVITRSFHETRRSSCPKQEAASQQDRRKQVSFSYVDKAKKKQESIDYKRCFAKVYMDVLPQRSEGAGSKTAGHVVKEESIKHQRNVNTSDSFHCKEDEFQKLFERVMISGQSR